MRDISKEIIGEEFLHRDDDIQKELEDVQKKIEDIEKARNVKRIQDLDMRGKASKTTHWTFL